MTAADAVRLPTRRVVHLDRACGAERGGTCRQLAGGSDSGWHDPEGGVTLDHIGIPGLLTGSGLALLLGTLVIVCGWKERTRTAVFG
ncbi:hypothetical protein [Deinococcus hopiensis]|uniref:Uncharacterized protein n=1 Tax=Deinococcus hopiensis KR-140 TaxID=695939 RepID=A0A1W1UTQ8_9DEIO|nr:hypothetical protein [Deinococcus hopiensis]SMB84443.1 hypothetical protein SAMN00790413_05135 [Deinococcus hopiensis KR-140]